VKHEIAVNRQRKRRGRRVRSHLKRNSVRPRLSVFRSHKHIYAQLIDDAAGRTLAAASTLDRDVREKIGGYGGNKAAAQVVGEAIARRAIEAGVTQAAFDRREYKYHGRIAALADAARDAGLDLGPKAVVTDEEKKPAKKAKPQKTGPETAPPKVETKPTPQNTAKGKADAKSKDKGKKTN